MIWDWFVENWDSFVATAIAIFSLHANTKAVRLSNDLAITGAHRDLWREYRENPDLRRVRDSMADLAKTPISEKEHDFVVSVILHLATVVRARGNRLVSNEEKLREDVATFFENPLPAEVWRATRQFRDRRLVKFVEGCIDTRNTIQMK